MIYFTDKSKSIKSKLTLCLALFIIALIPTQALAQLDVEHYIPPVFGREDKGTHRIVLSTPNAAPFTVTITDGAGTVIATPTISSATSFSYLLGTGDATQFLVTEAELNTIMTDEGLILTAAEPFYVNMRVFAGPQGGSLTSKGSQAAFGQDFYVGGMFNNTGDSFRKSNSFGIMATTNGTTVNISGISPGVIFRGTTPVGSPLTTQNTTITLNAGESYVMSAYMDEASSTNNVNGVNGTHITSDKDIVVNCATWLGGNALTPTPNQGRDLGIDQIVPVETVGDEYVLIKGEGIDNEKTIVIATASNTDIFLDGNPTAVTTLANPGDFYVVDGTVFHPLNENLYLTASSPVYLYQTSNGGDGATDDNERQCGLNFLPPIGCSGGKSVILPDVDAIGTAFINIIADAGAIVYVNGVLQGSGDTIAGTQNYVTYKLTSGYTGDVTITSDKLLRVALINVSGNIGATGYFSGFTKDFNVQTNTINGDNIALEGCIAGGFTFGIDAPSTTPTDISYQIWGTATNGVDYDLIDTLVTIPAGQTQASIVINSITDGIPEGQESIFIVYQPDLCSPLDTAFLYIDDSQPIDFTLTETDLTCYDNSTGEILANITGGFPPYTIEVTDPLGGLTSYTTNPITGLDAGTYQVQIYDSYGCKAEALVVGGVFDADTLFLPDGNGVTYTSQIPITGFGSTATIDSLAQINSICATLEHSYLGDLEIELIAPSGQSVILKQQGGGGSCDLGEPIATAPVDGAASSTLVDPGVGYQYCFNSSPTFGTMVGESNNFTRNYTDAQGNNYTDRYLPAGSYQSFQPLSNLLGANMDGNWTMEITDNLNLDNGYLFEWNISLIGAFPDTLVVINEPDSIQINGIITQAQCGGNDGAIDINVSGDFPPFTFLWSNGAVTEDLTNIPAGNYTVNVTDANGCTDSLTFNLNNISSMSITSSVTTVNCVGGITGAIDITPFGGLLPYTFLWSNGAVTEDISGLTAGSYTVNITDGNNCQFSEAINVTSLPPISISLNNSSDEFCGQSNGSISINVTGGSGSYGFSWDNGAATQNLTNISGGTYIVTVTDANGCQENQSFTILNNVSNCSSFCFLTVQASTTDENCGNGTGTIDITISQAAQPYIFTWNNGATTEDLSNLNAGTYTITVTDANQCVETLDVTIGNNTGNLTISSNQLSNENCGNVDGAIDINVSGGTLPYTFSWDNGATTEDITSLTAGDYTVTITDGNGCTFNETYTIINNTGNLAATTTIINEICGNGAGAINLIVTGNAGTLSFLWNNGAVTEDLTGLSAGLYSCTITDANGCILSTPSYNVINESSTLLLANTSVTNEDCGNGAGAIDITIQGGTAPITFLWNNSAVTEDITGLSAGTYSCTITDNNGCQVQTGTLNLFNSPGNLSIATDFVTDEICGNGAGAIFVTTTGGTAPITYSWDNGSSSEDISNISAGTYILTATDANGCSFNHNETVNNTSGTLSIDNAVVTDENCNDGTGAIDLFISGGTTPYTFLWNNGAITEDLTGLSAGSYNVTITDANGCSANESYTVNNNTNTLAVTFVATAENCSNSAGAIDLTVTGGTMPYTFLWNNAATTEDLTSISGGTYSCIITDGTGCEILTGDIIINNNPGSLAISNVTTDESCGDGSGSITLNVTGGATPNTFVWNPNVSSSNIATGLAAGMYIYTVTDANSCTITDSAEIFNNAGSLSHNNTVTTDEMCGDGAGAIDITVSGGTAPLNFLWNNAATTEDLTGLSTGVYSCVITDAAGCSINTGNINVSNNSGTLAIDNIVINDENCGNGLGGINITIIGGTTPYTFLWNTGATTEDLLTGLSAGNYTCDVTDANGCSVQVQATVQNNSGNLFTISNVVTDESCGLSNGAINLNPQGGTTPYTFLWNNGSVTEDLTGLAAGNYTVTITDAGGCTLNENFTVSNNGANITISSISINDEVCGNSAGAIDITISGGTSPFTFAWSNGAATEDLTGLSAGNFSVTVTDVNGCFTNGNFDVNENNGNLAIDTIVLTNEICGDTTGAIDVTLVNAGTPCCSYTLNMYDANNNGWGGNPAPQVQVYVNGTPIGPFTIPPGAGNSIRTESIPVCTGETIAVEFLPGAFNQFSSYDIEDAAGTTLFTSGNNPGPGIAFNTTANCPTSTPTVSYLWSNGAITEDLIGISGGTYTLTITDGNGCSIDTTNTIQNITGGFTASITSVTDENCGDGAGAIDITVAGGTTPYTFLWSNGAATEDLTGLPANTYNVTITDATGCSIMLDTVVNNNTGSLSIDNVIINNENCGDGTGFIDLTVSGTNAPITFSWSNGPTTEDLSGLSAGNYIVTITDGTGCVLTENYDILNNNGGLTTNITMNDENCGQSNGNITADVSGGVGPYIISWVGGTPTNCCTYTLDMRDTGNSWNGGSIDVFVDGVNIGNYTVFGGGANTGTFNVCTGQSIELFWNSGAFDNEVSFDLLDGSGAIVFTQGPSPTVGSIFTGTASCPAGPNNTSSLNNIPAGGYSVTVTDAFGCSTFDTITVINIPGQIIAGIVTDESCGNGLGAIDVTITGGVAPLSINWDNGATTEDLNSLTAGDYILNVSDNNGCNTIDTFTVTNTTTFTTSNIIIDDTCSNSIGEIDLTVTGGTAPITFSWDNGATTEDLTGLNAGTYIVNTSDASGCSKLDTFVVNNITTFTHSATIVEDTCNNGVGAIDITITGGTAPFTFAWDNGAITEDLTGLNMGTYKVTITDASGCSTLDSFVVNNIASFTHTANITDDFCNSGFGSIDLTITGGLAPFNFIWSNGEITEDLTALNSGDYIVNITDASGCTATDTFTVNNTITFTYTSSIEDDSCNTGIGSIDLTITGGTPPFSFAWSNGATTEDLTGLNAGTYTVTISDGGFCSTVDSFTVNTVSSEDATFSYAESVFCQDGTDPITIITGTIGGQFTSSSELSIISTTGEIDLSASTPGTYGILYTTPGLCPDTLTQFITINNCDTTTNPPTDSTMLSIPEGFSPNGDGVNEVFKITGLENYPDHTFIIFNRWGNKVFKAAPYNNDWTGTSEFGVTIGGNELPVGTYFYILDLGNGDDPIKNYLYLNK
ncbi:MAG: gliding motility-associated C-terminal domain-containing protein [Vicingaceae bacterium]|nr:gliding motility-associated C-terminal domain-containing protein [Vicingaceae bacterium]